MKRVAVWLLVMVTCFGTCQLYAAPSKCTSVGRAIVFLFRFAREHNWPRWVVWLLLVVGLLVFVGMIVEYFSDKKKEKKQHETIMTRKV
jgi:peptidoglycan/LPS O-acetylase OafA/YrhL